MHWVYLLYVPTYFHCGDSSPEFQTMDHHSYQQSTELHAAKINGSSYSSALAGLDHNLRRKSLCDLQHEYEDDCSQTPSLTDGSSRTSSEYSTSEHTLVTSKRNNSTQSQLSRGVSDTEGPWCPLELLDENSYQCRQTQSPQQLWRSTASKPLGDSTLPSLSSTKYIDVDGCGNHLPLTTISIGADIGHFNQQQPYPIKALPIQTASTRYPPAAKKTSGLQYMRKQPDSLGSDSDSTESDCESEEDSANETDCGDDEWSGVNDYFESAIIQAVYPDLELAAHLITQLYSMFYPGASKTISRKVSSWRENIRTCNTGSGGSGTTEKGPVPSSSTIPSTSKPGSSKRDRPSGSPDSTNDEDGEEDDDDADENRRKRFKENNLDVRTVIPAQKFACPFHKFASSRYCVQYNPEGEVNDKQYRTCIGPGFRTIQLLKEHLKRKHYPVQCDRCYKTFTYKGSNRSSAVSELEWHRQLDVPCSRNTDLMKEGISDAQWTSLEEKKQARKRKGVPEEKPKSEGDKWKDIWRVLFPNVDVPPTPWYDSLAMFPAVRSQGLRTFLEVYERIIEVKLENIRSTKSDQELKSTLLALAQNGFQVWSLAGTCNDLSTSSKSYSSRSAPSFKSCATPTGPTPSPKPSNTSAFPSLEQSNAQNASSATNNVPTDHAQTLVNPQNTTHGIPFPPSSVSPSPHHAMPLTGDFNLVAPLATGHQTFHQSAYPSNLPENRAWENQMPQMQFSQPEFNNSITADYDDVSLGHGLHGGDYDMGGMPHGGMPNISLQLWDDPYPLRGFAPYGGTP